VNEQRTKLQPGASTAHAPVGDSVTVRPPFDPEEFARNAESGIRLAEGASAPPLPPTMPPPAGLPEYPTDLVPTSWSPRVALDADAIPALAVAGGDLDWFDLSPRARRVLPHVNGRDSAATISERCGLELGETIDVLDGLAHEGIIAAPGIPG
jgi:hypothetical protein